jgi:2-polyprenyl-6-methoxyphenol hydroxylase-like FAD-dependent oxidoreductase
MKKKILISGGGIAGLASAWWLERAGAQVTVVERAHTFEPLGHYLSLKSHGVRIVRDMGLLDACRQRELVFRALESHTSDGRLLRATSPDLLARSVDGMVLFRRADLHAALYDAVRDRTDVRFGTEVQTIRPAGDDVEVDLPGRTERFDLVLGADGIHSRVRRLVFGDGGVVPMGGRYVAVTVDYEHGFAPGAVATYMGCGQFVALYPRTGLNISAVVYHGDGGAVPTGRDARALRAFLLDAYGGFAPAVRRTFEALDDRSFVFTDTIAMVTLPAITRGRIVLLGDAAHCPTFLSGMGASLALQGAETLAGALAAHGHDLPAGLAAYERAIREVALGYQHSARRGRRALLTRSPLLTAMRNAAVAWTPEWVLGLSVRRFFHAQQARPSRTGSSA